MTNTQATTFDSKRPASNRSKVLHFKKNWSLRPRTVLILFSILIAALIGYTAFNLIAAARHARASLENITAIENSLSASQPDSPESQVANTALANLAGATSNLESLKTNLNHLNYLNNIPLIGRQKKAADHLTNAGLLTSSSLTKILSNKNSTEIEPGLDLVLDSGEVNFEALKELNALSINLSRNLELAKLELNLVPDSFVLDQIIDAKTSFSSKLDELTENNETLKAFTEIAPITFGQNNETKRYLVLFQNNTELRPTGGFIGSFGILEIKNGKIKSFKTDDIYSLNEAKNLDLLIEPPAPIAKHLEMDRLFLRDANWSPDFATSAKLILEMYQDITRDNNIDGVIAINPNLTASLLAATGPVQAPGYPYTFTSENLTTTLQNHVEREYANFGETESERKNIIGALNQEIINQIFSLPPEKWLDLSTNLNTALEKKDIQLYFTDPQTQSLVEEMNWAGRIRTNPESDYLAIISANLGAWKTDQCIETSAVRNVFEKDQGYLASIKITFNHTCAEQYLITPYRDHLRVYLPAGSELIYSQGFTADQSTYEELGHFVVSGFFEVAPLSNHEIFISYKLPDHIIQQIENSNYSLLVQNQAGLPSPLKLRNRLDLKGSIITRELTIDRDTLIE